MLSTKQWRYTVWPTDVIKVVFRICSILKLGASNVSDGFVGVACAEAGLCTSLYDLNAETSSVRVKIRHKRQIYLFDTNINFT